MYRRQILKGLAAASLLPALPRSAQIARARGTSLMRRVRPSDPSWPGPTEWARLNQMVGGNLIEPRGMFAACGAALDGTACDGRFHPVAMRRIPASSARLGLVYLNDQLLHGEIKHE